MDAVIFDCDGVLIDSETIAHEVELEAMKRLGLFFDSEHYKARFQGLAVKDWSAMLDEDHRAQLGRPMPDGFIASLSAEITRRVLADIRPIDGAVEAARSFRRLKAIASSSPKVELHGKIRGLGLWDDFDGHVYSGDDVARGKPAPDLFLLSAERLSVEPALCIVIEDSVNGVKAGVAAGMTVWGFVGGPHCLPDQSERLVAAGASHVLHHMNDVATALRSL
ncbi:MAG: HAD-IA family hydrolase [Alphaproteobacteria bacterium]|nr:HAD-IA family hydrolase [Alphaproteobacteria bacterium]